MVWASQGTVDDSTLGIDSVRSKPLKKRCCFRAGLSRYYSSKSQSFSSLDLVQCTQFGTSAMALAKRPLSFDLRRSSPRAGPGLSHATSSFLQDGGEQETSMSVTNEDDTAERCPCNDTIFGNPAEVFMTPSEIPSTSPLQLYDPCTLSSVSSGSCQQQRQYQLTAEYLSVLLPLQPSFSANASSAGATGATGSYSGGCASGTTRGGLSAAFSGSCSSSCGGSGCFGKSLSSSSSSSSSSAVAASFCCDSSAVSPSGRLWQAGGAQIVGLSYGGGVDRPACCAAEATGGATNRTWTQYTAVSGPVTSLETVTQTLLQCCSDDLKGVGIGSGCGRTTSGGGATTHIVAASHFTVCAASNSLPSGGSASRPRNCLSAGGYLCTMPLNSGTVMTATVALGGSAPTAMAVATETSCSCGPGNGGNGGVPSLGRKLGLGIANRRLRAAQAAGLVAVHSARQAAAGLWGSTEDMIASLTLSDRQQQLQSQSHQQQQPLVVRAPKSGSLSRGSEGFSWFANSGPRWQQQPLPEPQRPGDSSCPPFGFGREGLSYPTGTMPGAAAASAAPMPAAARAATLTPGRVSDSSCVVHSCVSLSDFGGRNSAMQQQQPQHDQWLCSSAPPASATFSRFNGGCC